MKKLNVLTAIFLAGLLIAGCSQKEDQLQDDSVNLKSASLKADYDMVPNEILVKFKDGTEASKKSLVFEKLGGKLKEKILTKMMEKQGDKNGIDLVTIPGNVADAIAKAKNLPEVEYAEPNYIYTYDVVSNDPYYLGTIGDLWGMYGDATSPANQYGSQAGEAWAVGHTGSEGVYVGVIDEGAMYGHVDLSGNFGNSVEIYNNGIDDDGNGKVDDTYGWDFVNNDNSTYDVGQDQHGTHVSGTIGATGGNGIGVAGINWKVKIISGKFLGPNGGTTANAVKAVDYFTDLKKNHNVNIVATNNSWGGGGYSQALYDAIERANQAGILFVAAAGNGNAGGKAINIDSKPSYPASYNNSNIIAVAAIDKNGAMATWSNYGKTSVDIGAPGVAIWSTLPSSTGGSTYGSYSGTSMATPHVTGAAALYASNNSGATAAQIKAAILSAAVPTASLAGKCVTGGRLNVSGF